MARSAGTRASEMSARRSGRVRSRRSDAASTERALVGGVGTRSVVGTGTESPMKPRTPRGLVLQPAGGLGGLGASLADGEASRSRGPSRPGSGRARRAAGAGWPRRRAARSGRTRGDPPLSTACSTGVLAGPSVTALHTVRAELALGVGQLAGVLHEEAGLADELPGTLRAGSGRYRRRAPRAPGRPPPRPLPPRRPRSGPSGSRRGRPRRRRGRPLRPLRPRSRRRPAWP